MEIGRNWAKEGKRVYISKKYNTEIQIQVYLCVLNSVAKPLR